MDEWMVCELGPKTIHHILILKRLQSWILVNRSFQKQNLQVEESTQLMENWAMVTSNAPWLL